MEKLIEDVLEEHRDTNLHSAAGRQVIVKAVMKQIRSSQQSWFLNMSTIDGKIPEVGDREEEVKWICEHCGKNTFHIDFDYIGSNYNHLACDLKAESPEKYGDDNHYVYSGDLKEAQNLKKTKLNLQDQAYLEMTSDGLPPGGDAQATRDAAKLAEQIAGGSADLGYIFESPDGGETIYRRKVGESERELVSKENWKQYNRNRHGIEVNDTK
jgi:hypothetical protein